LPKLKGVEKLSQKTGLWAFWIMTISMTVMGLAFGAAGIIQSYMQRGLGMDFLTVQGFMKPWFKVVFFGGLGFFIGVLIYIFDILKLAATQTLKVEQTGLKS
jgi:nitric oxide reductase subunit B